ncbi:uncharacterized protein MYCFIDRAFT_165453 [Pseudocercospora fijiensis CIRAD86]|uniref:Uncharacterized protein n=1 Tax=Pseudocercospora fijiensis (strain CIRAD86) TaxID=383855 RepID=M3AYV0_PSEFD|nr:uncharacterized protein MYCFIDRAFT_165453 [Pseudocercospora fijiensis CIRAD86]EME82343.1 hypothetical protein MYCFIDRAFT_165453 [Pseudocercospora fijiensis CIRAD86]
MTANEDDCLQVSCGLANKIRNGVPIPCQRFHELHVYPRITSGPEPLTSPHIHKNDGLEESKSKSCTSVGRLEHRDNESQNRETVLQWAIFAQVQSCSAILAIYTDVRIQESVTRRKTIESSCLANSHLMCLTNDDQACE